VSDVICAGPVQIMGWRAVENGTLTGCGMWRLALRGYYQCFSGGVSF